MKKHISASQINTWRMCKRRWAYSRIRPRTSSPATEFGTQAHEVAEDWLRDAKMPPDTLHGRCISAGLHLLPAPKTVKVEEAMKLRVGPVSYVGRIDFLSITPGVVALVGDHKTTSNLSYAKTPEELAADPQAIIYSMWAVETFDVETAVCYWVYYSKRAPEAKAVSLTTPRKTVEKRFKALHASDSLPILQAQGQDPKTLPRNVRSCYAFNRRCPYYEECWHGASPGERLAAKLEQDS